jgi:hypothetical protein
MNSSAMGGARGRLDVGVAGARPAEGDVVGARWRRRSVTSCGTMRDAAANLGWIGVAQVDAVDQTVPGLRIVEAQDAGKDGALARRPTARRWRRFRPASPQSSARARRHDRAARIGEVDTSEFDRAAACRPAAASDEAGAAMAGSSAAVRSAARRRPRPGSTRPRLRTARPARRPRRPNRAGTGRACQPTCALQHVARAEPQHGDDRGKDREDGEEGEHRARLDGRPRRLEGGLDRLAAKRPVTRRSLVKACSVRTAPICSPA